MRRQLATVALILCALLAATAQEGPTLAPGESPLVITELMASNRGFLFDEHWKTPDWIELHNRSGLPVPVGGYSLRRADRPEAPWTVPDLTVAPGEFVLVWMSGGKSKQQRAGPARGFWQGAPLEDWIIAPASEWQFRPPLAEGTGPDWRLPGFVAEGWRVGATPIGSGYEGATTDLERCPGQLLLRKQFELSRVDAAARLVMDLDYDDGFVAYLNGTQVAQSRLPHERVSGSTRSTSTRDAGRVERHDLSAFSGLLREGPNVLGIVLLNGARSTDIFVSPALGRLPPSLHASFRLDAKGGALELVTPAGEIADAVAYPAQVPDHSWGVSPGASSPWSYQIEPSPARANSGVTSPVAIDSKVVFEKAPGQRPESTILQFALAPPAPLIVRYTTDGREPGSESNTLKGVLSLQSTTTVRAAGFLQTARATPITTTTFLRQPSWGLPILALTVPPAELATMLEDWDVRGRRNELRANLELFDKSGTLQLATSVGLRQHGGRGRWDPTVLKKSYRLYFRDELGLGRFKTPIFETLAGEPARLVLRAGFNDRFRFQDPDPDLMRAAYCRDEIVRELHRQMGQLGASGDWCMLLLNGQLKGLYNITERIDADFLSRHLGKGDWDLIKTGGEVVSGGGDRWAALEAYVSEHDLAVDEHYEYVMAQFDPENFFSYLILNLWAQNEDWPDNNWLAYRRQGDDGVWRFLCWDAECTLGLEPAGHEMSPFEALAQEHYFLATLILSLWKHPNFRERFITETRRHLAATLRHDKVIALIDHHAARISGAIADERRMNALPATTDLWEANVEAMRNFARSRGAFFLRVLEEARDGVPPVEVK